MMIETKTPRSRARSGSARGLVGAWKTAAAGFLGALIVTLASWAGSTGTTQLMKPQGGGSGTSIGDFISNDNDSADPGTTNGLNTFYSYFFEVPPSLSRLRVQIFDADIGVDGGVGGDGNGQEDNDGLGGRDRCRGVPCDHASYDTEVVYSLVDPSGNTVGVQFADGDEDGPGNNAWLTLFNNRAPRLASSTSVTGSGTSIAVTVPAGSVGNDLLVAIVAVDGNSTSAITAPAGWSTIDEGASSGDDVRLGIFWRLAPSPPAASYSFSWTGTQQVVGIMLRYVNIDTTTPINAEAGAASNSSTNAPTAPAVTTTVDNAVVVRVYAQDESSTTAPPANDPHPSAHVGRFNLESSATDADAVTVGVADTVQTTAGSSGTATFLTGATQNSRRFSFAIAGPPSGQRVAPTFISSATGETPGATTVTVSRPSPSTTGDFLLAVIVRDGTGANITAPADTTAWIELDDVACAADCRAAVYYKFITSAESEPTSYAFNIGASDEAVGGILVFRGVDTSTPIEDSDFGNGNTGTPTAPASTTTSGNTTIVRFYGADDGDISGTPYPSGHTGIFTVESSDDEVSAGAAITTQIAVGGTGTAAFTMSATEQWRAATVVLRGLLAQNLLPLSGHWELRVDQSASGGNDLNGFGVRVDDGTESTSGTEIPLYYDSHTQIGVHPEQTSATNNGLNFDLYPYVTQGCSLFVNDFDFDRGNGGGNGPDQGPGGPNPPYGSIGSAAFTSRTALFSQTSGNDDRSGNDVWQRGTISGWADNDDAGEYGIWDMDYTIYTYDTGAGVNLINGNYANVWFSNSTVGSAVPTSQPTTGAFRTYLSTDAINASNANSTPPAKPYLEQHVRCFDSPCNLDPDDFVVTVRLVNPTGSGGPILLNGSTIGARTRQVTGTIPATNVTYQGLIGTPAGTTSFPAINGTGAWNWRPGTVTEGTTALLAYRIRVAANVITTATGSTQMIFRDHTENSAQERATYSFGSLCDLSVRGANVTPVTVHDFKVTRGKGGAVVEFTTDSELGATSYDLLRADARSPQFFKVAALPARMDSPQGAHYRIVDTNAPAKGAVRYTVVERGGDGATRKHGPFRFRMDRLRAASEAAMSVGENAREISVAAGSASSRPRAANAALPVRAAEEANAHWAAAEGRTDDTIRLRVGVSETGLVAVPLTDVANNWSLSLSAATTLAKKGQFSVWSGGDMISSFVSPDESSILFFGEHVHNVYSNETFYFVQNKKKAKTVDSIDGGAPAPSVSEQTFVDTAIAETDVFAGTIVVFDDNEDFWFWKSLFPSGGFDTHSFQINAPALRSADGTLRLWMHGSSTGTHDAEVRVNGALLGNISFDGMIASTATVPVPAANLLEGSNDVEVKLLTGSFFFNRASLEYLRANEVAGDSLLLPHGTNGLVTVDGLSGSTVAVLELLGGGKFKRVTNLTEAGGEVSFEANGASYLIAGPGGLGAPSSSNGRPAQAKPVGSQSVEYLVIAPSALSGGAQALASYRSSQGLPSRVVSLEDLLDAYADGANDPRALSSYLEAIWKRPEKKTRYVVLVGGGTFDYRNVQGHNDNLLPAMLTATPEGLYASDSSLGDLSGNDGVPEILIGRIPALSNAELLDYVAKVQAYEAASAGDALLVADNDETGFAFHGDQFFVADGFQPGYDVDRVDLAATDAGSVNAARAGLFAGWTSERGYVSYLGHGGVTTLTSDGLFSSADVASLPAGTTPVLFGWTCLINRFEIPGVSSLGEDMVRRAGGGAVASWAPAGLSEHPEGVAYGRLFAQALQRGGRLGDAWKTAAVNYKAAGGSTNILRLYGLLGDPAIQLPVATPEPVGPSEGGE